MFKKISEAYAVLSNDKRRKKYDLFGTTEDDDFGDDNFSSMFTDLFGGGGLFGGAFGGEDDFESFMDILEKDNIKSFDKMFRGMGKNYRTTGKYNHAGGLRSRGKKNAKNKKQKGKGGLDGLDEEDEMEMMMAMMMGDMMGGMGMMGEDDFGDDPFGFPGMKMPPGFPGGPKSKKKDKGKDKDKSKKETKKAAKEDSDDGWETNSEEEVIEGKITKDKDKDKDINENKAKT